MFVKQLAIRGSWAVQRELSFEVTGQLRSISLDDERAKHVPHDVTVGESIGTVPVCRITGVGGRRLSVWHADGP